MEKSEFGEGGREIKVVMLLVRLTRSYLQLFSLGGLYVKIILFLCMVPIIRHLIVK